MGLNIREFYEVSRVIFCGPAFYAHHAWRRCFRGNQAPAPPPPLKRPGISRYLTSQRWPASSSRNYYFNGTVRDGDEDKYGVVRSSSAAPRGRCASGLRREETRGGVRPYLITLEASAGYSSRGYFKGGIPVYIDKTRAW
jgi:hypothetical protein